MSNGNDVPKMPPAALLELDKLGTINKMHITYQQTGTDTAETFVNLGGDNGQHWAIRWSEVAEYLDVVVQYASCCHIKREYRLMLEKWFAFEKKNHHELTEYKRLKAKFESV